MLVIKNIHQSFRAGFWMKRTEILKDISFTIPSKTIFGFLGPNGAGKTTLIHLITGLKRPVSGSIELDGVNCSLPEARARVGYLPERPYFHEHLTGAGLLRYFGRLSGMTDAAIDAKTGPVLESVGMSHARDLELSKFSKGMLQRVGIAQAIIHDPDFLVLDEPMSGLDPVGRKEMRELILKLAREGRTVFFSSHVIPDVESICDQVAVIRKGKLVQCGSVSSFLSQESTETELGFSGLTLAQTERLTNLKEVREIPEGIRARLTDSQKLDQTLKMVMEAGGRIHFVNPIRRSLEEVFES